MRNRLMLILISLIFLVSIFACGWSSNNACYSNYPGCEETATFIATAAAQ